MAYKHSYEDDESGEDDSDDPENPDRSDMDDDNGDGAVDECPWCGADVAEGASRCPGCGKYLSEEDAPSRKPAWIVVVAGVLIVAILVTWVLWGP